jgi:predicted ribosomally synthesized peptide with nif11-like leader
MSRTAVKSFLELIHMNRVLRTRIEQIPPDRLAIERVLALAERYGYRFDAGDLARFLDEPRELTHAELEGAAGGTGLPAGSTPFDRFLGLLAG